MPNVVYNLTMQCNYDCFEVVATSLLNNFPILYSV